MLPPPLFIIRRRLTVSKGYDKRPAYICMYIYIYIHTYIYTCTQRHNYIKIGTFTHLPGGISSSLSCFQCVINTCVCWILRCLWGTKHSLKNVFMSASSVEVSHFCQDLCVAGFVYVSLCASTCVYESCRSIRQFKL